MEETGNQLKPLLCRVDLWEGQACHRPQGQPGKCRDRNLVYQNTCLECEEVGITTRYVGETNRSLGERSWDHQQDAISIKMGSNIRDHVASAHPAKLSSMLDLFKMTVIKSCRSALQRQVREATEIVNDRSDFLLNSKEEYNRCVLPALRVEGPTNATKKVLEEQTDNNQVILTREQEEMAISQAKQDLIKKRRVGKDNIRQEAKRLRLERTQVVKEGPDDDINHDDDSKGQQL